MQLDGEVDVAQAGRGEESDDHDPARERRRIDRIEILAPVPVHPILSATRSLALRERGLARCSIASGSTGFGVMRRKKIRDWAAARAIPAGRAIRGCGRGRNSSRSDPRASER